jgi:ATP-dependent helicase/nuclease subunit B
MDVVFGWDLDVLHFPETSSGASADFNSPICGPSSFLRLLETRLGLGRQACPRVLRIADYLILLRKADDGNRFFSASLQSDSWATADYLLSLRDELVVSGWNRKPIGGLEKLGDLLAVEAEGSIAEGFGERLQRVNDTLRESCKTIFDRLRIVGQLAHLPDVWKRTIELLVDSGTKLQEIECCTLADETTDLHLIQNGLINSWNSDKISLKGDGSVAVLDADDELQAALFTASWLHQRQDCSDILLLRGSDCSILSQMFERQSLPNAGGASRSRNRAMLQVLPLAFEAVCRPIDPGKIVELLSLQGGPLPLWMSSPLMNALQQAPGIGGANWEAAWNQCVDKQVNFVLRDDPRLSKTTARKLAESIVSEWRLWFVECVSKDDPHKTISTANVMAICNRVGTWAVQQQKVASKAVQKLYELAAWQASVLGRLVTRVFPESIPMTQLRKMLEAVADYGASLSTIEASLWSLIDKPGQLWGQAQTVVWWGFALSKSMAPQRAIWSDDEFLRMREHGILLERPEEKVRRDSSLWKMPILNARERIVLIKARVVAGERAAPHPVWDEISSMIDTVSLQRITRQASDLFRHQELEFSNSLIKSEAQGSQSLPGALRIWSVAPNLIRARSDESYSGVNSMLGCPLAWVLQYGAGLWQPRSLNLPEKQQLLGILAHATLRVLFDEQKNWEPDDAKERASRIVTTLIPQMASALLLPGMSPQLREALDAIPNATFHLVTFLNGAGATVEACEMPLKAQLTNATRLGGKVDMMLKLSTGRRAILDFKWSSSPYWYRRQIAEGKSLQLAIYSWLAAETDKLAAETSTVDGGDNGAQDPPAGYFMFRHGELFFTEDGIFPQHTLVRKMARTLGETFQISLEAYERAREKVSSGTLIATGIVDHTLDCFEPQSLVEPPCNFCEFGHFCGKMELE